MSEPVMDKDAPGEWENLRLVLKATEGSRVNKPVAVALKLGAVIVAQMARFLSEPLVGNKL